MSVSSSSYIVSTPGGIVREYFLFTIAAILTRVILSAPSKTSSLADFSSLILTSAGPASSLPGPPLPPTWPGTPSAPRASNLMLGAAVHAATVIFPAEGPGYPTVKSPATQGACGGVGFGSKQLVQPVAQAFLAWAHSRGGPPNKRLATVQRLNEDSG